MMLASGASGMDTLGNLLKVVVHGANIHDRDRAGLLLEQPGRSLWRPGSGLGA